MRILGVNKGSTLSGKELRFGGAALYDDGRFTALGEERASGAKYAGGYSASLQQLLESADLDVGADVDYIAASTCCEPVSAAVAGHDLAGHEKLLPVNHHLSHAALAYFGSGFEHALVVVADGGGNTLTESGAPQRRWWEKPREQCSYYLGSPAGLELVSRDFELPGEVGLGEMYRAFTYFLGWHSSTYASRTMALAGHGRRDAIRAEPYELVGDRLSSALRNDPDDPIGMVHRLGQILGVDFEEPRMPGQAILRIHRDVAAFVQQAVEAALLRKLTMLRKQLRVDRVCIAGGIAHNVVLNGRLPEVFSGGVYVPSAPGDEGQCLGNIYAVLSSLGLHSSAPSMTQSSSVCIGPHVTIDAAAVAGGLKAADLSSYVVFETSDYAQMMASFLASGGVVCLYQERSEFGPRALGSRSILADPRRADVTSELNSLKQREWFMPFAPTVLSDRAHEWFAAANASPFMSFAHQATPHAVNRLPGVVNADGSSRVQTVDEDDGQPITSILTHFAKETGVPILLNTSFNMGGEPIVESIPQALAAFSRMPINVLGIGRFVVLKSLSPTPADLPLAGSVRGLDLRVREAAGEARVETGVVGISTVIRQLQNLTGSVVFVRTELPLYGPYLKWLREGQKVTTIRFRSGAVEIPVSKVLPLYKTDDYSPGDRSRPTDYVRIGGILYQRFGDLSARDAERDGFASLEHMRRDLRKIYPTLAGDSWVTVYEISLAGHVIEDAIAP